MEGDQRAGRGQVNDLDDEEIRDYVVSVANW